LLKEELLWRDRRPDYRDQQHDFTGLPWEVAGRNISRRSAMGGWTEKLGAEPRATKPARERRTGGSLPC
jgi:hypothetical protein